MSDPDQHDPRTPPAPHPTFGTFQVAHQAGLYQLPESAGGEEVYPNPTRRPGGAFGFLTAALALQAAGRSEKAEALWPDPRTEQAHRHQPALMLLSRAGAYCALEIDRLVEVYQDCIVDHARLDADTEDGVGPRCPQCGCRGQERALLRSYADARDPDTAWWNATLELPWPRVRRGLEATTVLVEALEEQLEEEDVGLPDAVDIHRKLAEHRGARGVWKLLDALARGQHPAVDGPGDVNTPGPSSRAAIAREAREGMADVARLGAAVETLRAAVASGDRPNLREGWHQVWKAAEDALANIGVPPHAHDASTWPGQVLQRQLEAKLEDVPARYRRGGPSGVVALVHTVGALANLAHALDREGVQVLAPGDAPVHPARVEPLRDRDHVTPDLEIQSDKYSWCPPGFVPLKLTDPDARRVLRLYAKMHEPRDPDFAHDLLECIYHEEEGEGAHESMTEAALHVVGAIRARLPLHLVGGSYSIPRRRVCPECRQPGVRGHGILSAVDAKGGKLVTTYQCPRGHDFQHKRSKPDAPESFQGEPPARDVGKVWCGYCLQAYTPRAVCEADFQCPTCQNGQHLLDYMEAPPERHQARERKARDLSTVYGSDTWQEAVEGLRRHLRETGQMEKLRELMDREEDRRFPARRHLWGGGMAIRNWLRAAGYSEGELGVDNLDNVYGEILYEAVWEEPAVRQPGAADPDGDTP